MRRGKRPLLYGKTISISEFHPRLPFRDVLRNLGADVITDLVLDAPDDYELDPRTIVADGRIMGALPTSDILTTPLPESPMTEWATIDHRIKGTRPKAIIAWSIREPKNMEYWDRLMSAFGYTNHSFHLDSEHFGIDLWFTVSSTVPYKGHGWGRMNDPPSGPYDCIDAIIYGIVISQII